MDQGNFSRRGFLQRSFAALTLGAGLPAWYARELLASDQEKAAGEKKAIGANDKINMGVIGLGPPPRRALDLYHGAKGNKQVQFVATCNVDAGHLKFAIDEMKKGGYDATGYKDYRELLDRKDIDAVLIAVPDHWHTLIAIDALRKKKDIYSEKPLTLTVAEGQALVKVAKGTDRVFQVGSQQRSEGAFRLACELVRNGRVGKIKTVETRIGGIDKNKTGPFKTAPVPEGLDWELWQGQTAKVPFIPQRCHYEFRWWYEYSGGKMTDWGAHHNDIAQWGLGMDESGPIAVEATGEADKRPDCYNVHSSFTVKYKYASGAELICAHTQLDGAIDPKEDKYTDKDGKEKAHRHDNGVLFRGEDDKWIFVNREIITASDKKLIDEPLPKDAVRLYPSTNHMGNFLDCLKTRKPTTCTAEIGHRSVTVCHIGVIALRTGKKLKWDPVKEVFDDAEANKMLSRPMEKPWQL
ncbi:MAG TPA: Gfo/Idh/MocA family oxidoreductase, partial [Gemmataceae bacterium]